MTTCTLPCQILGTKNDLVNLVFNVLLVMEKETKAKSNFQYR